MNLYDIVSPMTVDEAKATKQRLDAKCWKGYKKQGTKVKGGVRVNNCVPNESVSEAIGYESNKAYAEVGLYKRYTVYVTKKKFNDKFGFIAVAVNPRTNDAKFKSAGPTQQEAVANLQAEVDKEIDVATKVSGSATVDFNVDFVRDVLEMSSNTFYAKIIPGPKLVIAGKEMEQYPDIMKQEGFKASSIRTVSDSEGATKLPAMPLSASGATTAQLIANGRYALGTETIDRDGNRIFDLEFDSVVADPRERIRMGAPAITIGTKRETKEDSWHAGDNAWSSDQHEMVESPMFSNGDQVELKPEYADRAGEVYTVSQCDRERGRCWIGDADGRGWYARFDQLVPAVGQDDVEEGWSDAVVAQRTGRPRTPYSVYIKGKKWKDFENDDHAEAVANKLRAKFKQEGRDPSVITIAATDYDKDLKEFALGKGEEDPNDLTDEAFKDGQRLGYSLVDGATRAKGFEVSQYLDKYLVPFSYGWNAGRKMKIKQAQQDGVALTMKKDGSLARAEQGVAEGVPVNDLLGKVTKDANKLFKKAKAGELKSTGKDFTKGDHWTGPDKDDPSYTRNFGHGYPNTPDNRSHDRYVKKSLKKGVAEETREAELNRKFNSPEQLKKDADYRAYRAGVKASRKQPPTPLPVKEDWIDDNAAEPLARYFADLYYGDFSATEKVKLTAYIYQSIQNGKLSIDQLKADIDMLEKEKGIKEQGVAEADETSWTANSAKFRQEEDMSWPVEVTLEPKDDINQGRGAQVKTMTVTGQSRDAAKKKLVDYFRKNGWAVTGIKFTGDLDEGSFAHDQLKGEINDLFKPVVLQIVKWARAEGMTAKDLAGTSSHFFLDALDPDTYDRTQHLPDNYFNKLMDKANAKAVEILKKKGVAEDVSRLTDAEYNRVAGYVRKKYPGAQLSGLGRNEDGSFNVMIDTGSGRHEFKVRFRDPEETDIGEGWKSKAAAATVAGALASQAGAYPNPNRIIDGQGRSAANPYGNVDSQGHVIKKPEAPKADAPKEKETKKPVKESYWTKLQNERNTKLNSLVNELKESIKK